MNTNYVRFHPARFVRFAVDFNSPTEVPEFIPTKGAPTVSTDAVSFNWALFWFILFLITLGLLSLSTYLFRRWLVHILRNAVEILLVNVGLVPSEVFPAGWSTEGSPRAIPLNQLEGTDRVAVHEQVIVQPCEVSAFDAPAHADTTSTSTITVA